MGTSRVRERIIATATRLFGFSGFHQTPMSELAAEASVSVGSIYRMFRDKDDLIVAIVRSDLERRLQIMESIVPHVRSGFITVEDGLYQIIENVMPHKDGTLLLDIQAESSRNSTVAYEIDQFCRRLRHLVCELAYFGNPDLQDQRLDDVQEVLLGIAFRPGWSGLPRTQTDANADAVQAIRIIRKILHAF
jgi:TetR/AcrR family transcriptional repressor of uid operon